MARSCTSSPAVPAIRSLLSQADVGTHSMPLSVRRSVSRPAVAAASWSRGSVLRGAGRNVGRVSVST